VDPQEGPRSGPMDDDSYAAARADMVERQVAARGIDDERVLAALRAVPRHRFVPAEFAREAYDDGPLPIGHGQTISQPYVVAFMTQIADLQPGERVLEVGTGSGYQAAVLAELGCEVWTVEIVQALAERAARDLREAGYTSVHVRAGDGYRGWPEHAPFDAIVVTAAPDHVPEPLLEQLAVGGRLVLPVGPQGWAGQEIVRITRTAEGYEREELLPVRFVPMTGEAQRR
ncbi:MAG TPA: protein-L-isoaspartate(D-aspartate) O-methyltransferase, partial [Planctomycetota bacterium]|nr:protein-L-isoaspartate(D-aspartate) O-methyltransferase [Planctomycetota bacterium]